MDQLSAPQVTARTWELLYNQLGQFKSLVPWEVLADADLFGVTCPRTGQLGFGTVLGNGGVCFGLVVYRGRSGFRNFVDLQMKAVNEEEFAHQQDLVLAEFTERKFLEPPDLEVIRNLGLKFRGQHSWPLLRSCRPNHLPWFVDENDALLLISVLEVTTLVVAETATNPDFTHGENGDFLPLYSFNKGTWTHEWKDKGYFLKPDPSAPVRLVPKDNKVARIAKGTLEFGGRWELGIFSLPVPVADDRGRPSLPKICAVLDAETGVALCVEIADAARESGDFVRDTMLKAIDKVGRSPQFLHAADELLLEGIAPWTASMGIEVVMTELVHFPLFRSELLEHSKGTVSPKKPAKKGRSLKNTTFADLYYEVEVSLQHVEPRLWRTFQIKASATFQDLHLAIQQACDWENAHLFEFRTKLGRGGEVLCSDDSDVTPDELQLIDFFDQSKKCVYIYDFGDGWEHEIRLRKKLKLEEKFKRRLIAGEGSFPPEDCGGIYGYYRCVNVLRGVEHDEEFKDWLGSWKPDGFKLKKAQAGFNR